MTLTSVASVHVFLTSNPTARGVRSPSVVAFIPCAPAKAVRAAFALRFVFRFFGGSKVLGFWVFGGSEFFWARRVNTS